MRGAAFELLQVGTYLPAEQGPYGIGLIHASRLSVFLERIVRWAAEALFALTTMTACSQRVELRAA